MKCPRDRLPLERVSLDHATKFVCGTCAGCALTVTLLRRMMPRERLRELWALVRSGVSADAPCPSCARTMRLVALGDGPRTLQLDGCSACQVVWFDAGELHALAPDGAAPAPVLDAQVPADASDTWIWASFFRTINEKHFGGLS